MIVLEDLNRVLGFVSSHEEEFIELVSSNSRTEADKQTRQSKRELDSANTRIGKINDIFQKLYENNMSGKITDEWFHTMSASYETEQKKLKERVEELNKILDTIKEQKANTSSFISLVKEFTTVKELSPEIIRLFIEKILIHQKQKVDGKRIQEIEIFYTGIGKISVS